MSYTCFDVSLEDKIAHIVLKRPEAYNTMIPEFWSELPEIVRTIDDAGEARAIVISSTGKHFTAGMDLSVFTSSQRRTTATPRWAGAAPTSAATSCGSRRRSRASTARACPCSPRCRAAASAAAST